MPDDERDSEIQRRIKGESEYPFDLSAGSLLQIDAAPCWRPGAYSDPNDSPQRFRRLVDGDPTREIWTLYEAFSNGKSSSLERLPVQYSDYAVWQRNWLQSEILERSSPTGKGNSKISPSSICQPTDRGRHIKAFRGARVPITLPQPLTESVKT